MDVFACLATAMDWVESVPGPTWAAWFQAIGTLAGIFVAWKVGQDQWRKHLKKEGSLDKDSVKAVYVLISRASTLVRLAEESRQGVLPATPSYSSIRSLEIIASKLESFDLVRRPTPAVLRMSLASATEIHKFLGDLKKWESTKIFPSNSRLQAIAQQLQKYGDNLLEHYQINEDNWNHE